MLLRDPFVMTGIFSSAIDNFLEPIADLLEDESVSEVMINGPKEIFIERAGKVEKVNNEFPDEDTLVAAVNNIAQSVGRVIDDENPTLDARLPPPKNYRIHAVIPPCARNGTTVAIRKFSKVSMTLKDCIRFQTMTPDVAQFLDLSVFLGKNCLISGGTGSGKTTLLGLLAGRIPRGQRVIVIEDASELSIEYEHVVFFETKMADEEGKGEVTIRDLLKSSLRLRPDRIVVGEVRGAEALELISAMNTGHKGCFGTIHSNSPADALIRLEALAMGAEAKISEKAIGQQIGSAIDLIVQISRFSDGRRRIQSIAEVMGYENGCYDVQTLYELDNLQKGPTGDLVGTIQPTGILPTYMHEIESNRIPFPSSKFKKAA